MIYTTNIELNPTATEIAVTVSTEIGFTFTGVFLSTDETFSQDPVDLTGKLLGISNSETFSITLADAGLTSFSGVIYLTFVTNEVATLTYTPSKVGVVANLTAEYECLLDQVLKIDVENCGRVNTDCGECNSRAAEVSALLHSLSIALVGNYIDESVKIMREIKSVCNTCNTCTPNSTLTLLPGTGFKTVNSIIQPI